MTTTELHTMPSDFSSLAVLAQTAPPIAGGKGDAAPLGGAPATTAPGAPAGTPSTPPPGPNMLTLMLPIILVFAVMMIFSARTQKKEQKKRLDLLSSIARYDRVQTAGGVIGTVVDIKDDEVVLKVDETTGARITFAKSAVQSVLRKGRGSSSDAESAAA